MELLTNLGIDIKLLLAQMVNFGILLFVLSKFVYKPIVERIEKDEHTLEKAHKETSNLEQEKEEFKKEKKQTIAEGKKRAREIVKEAEDIAEEIQKRAREEAEHEKQAVIGQIHDRLKAIDDEQKFKS